MFVKKPLKATKLKRIIYLIAASIFGTLIDYFILVAIQTFYLQGILHSEKNLIWYSGYPPHFIFLIGFLTLGAIWGFIAGRRWWQIIYIEHKYRKLFTER